MRGYTGVMGRIPTRILGWAAKLLAVRVLLGSLVGKARPRLRFSVSGGASETLINLKEAGREELEYLERLSVCSGFWNNPWT